MLGRRGSEGTVGDAAGVGCCVCWKRGRINLSGFGWLTRQSHSLSWGPQGGQIQRGKEEFAFGYSVPAGSTGGDASSVELRK